MLDEDPFEGMTYYRLKQTDHNRTSNYSPIVAISFEYEKEFSLFPNPSATGMSVYLSLHQASSGSAEIALFDLTGKCIYTQQGIFEAGKAVQINASLQQGIYLVRLYTGNRSLIKKLVVN